MFDAGGLLNRRDWLQSGAAASGLALADALPEPNASVAADANQRIPGFGRAKSVLIVFASGGQSQFETWDPKPDAPLEIRGEFSAIESTVPGMLLTEHLPMTAQMADKFTIVKSMSHLDLDHGSAFYLSMTGRYHDRLSSNPPPRASDYPCHGAILKNIRPTKKFVETAIHINGPAQVPIFIGPGQFGGLMGAKYDPMTIGNVNANKVVFPGLMSQEQLSTARMRARQTLLQSVESQTRQLEGRRKLLDADSLYRRAFEMLERPETRNAFDLSTEPAKLRDRYGRNRAAQACLLARRLVEAGVPLITVFFNHSNRGQDTKPDDTDSYGWDTHNDIFKALKVHLLPRFDRGFSALLEDMDQRGLLKETLVICMGEFGRAPLVALEPRFAGSTPGRKHWASVYSIVVAGAGVKRGSVLGRSDRAGAYPASEKYGPWDIAATVFSALGIDPSGHYTDAAGRQLGISEGKPISGLYSG